jgi:putative ABC transport system ATP-binding protein
MIEIKNLSLKFDDKMLFNGLSFSVDKGEMACITGPSGSGKTSLLRAILGFIPVSNGTISIDGEQVTGLSAVTFRQMTTYLPQELSLPCETVNEMVQLPFELKANHDIKFSKGNLMEEWQKLGLEVSLFDKKVSEISGGQRQRIMLAVSGLLKKELVLVDEPTSALDETSSRLVSAYLASMAAHGATVIAVSHDSEFAVKCNKLIRLNNGDN